MLRIKQTNESKSLVHGTSLNQCFSVLLIVKRICSALESAICTVKFVYQRVFELQHLNRISVGRGIPCGDNTGNIPYLIPSKSCVAQLPGQADFLFMSLFIIFMIKNV